MGRIVRIGDVEVERHHLKWVEGELRSHEARKRRLNLLEERFGGLTREDIIWATPPREPGVPGAPGPGNPTLSKVQQIMACQEMMYLRLQVQAVEETFHSLPEDLQEVVKTVYFDGRYTMAGAAEHLHMDERTLRRHKNKALLAFVYALLGEQAVSRVRKLPDLKVSTGYNGYSG